MENNNTLALLAGMDVSTAKPDAGGFQLPDNGIHTAQVKDLIVEGGDRAKFGSKASNVPGVNIVFVYEIQPEPGTNASPMTFYGERFRLPTAAQRSAALALDGGKYVKTLAITEGRLNQAIRVLLDRAPSANLQDDILAISKMLKDAPVIVRVKTRQWQSQGKAADGTTKTYDNFVEHIQEKLSS